MKILSILTPAPTAERSDFERLSVDEEIRLWQLYSGHQLREMYFQPEPIKVLLIWEASTPSEVQNWLGTLPMMQAGLLQSELITLGPWLQLQALFRDNVLR